MNVDEDEESKDYNAKHWHEWITKICLGSSSYLFLFCWFSGVGRLFHTYWIRLHIFLRNISPGILSFWLKARPLHSRRSKLSGCGASFRGWTTLTLQTRYSRQVSMTIIHAFASDIGSPQFTSCSRNLLCLKSVWCFLSSPTSPSWPCCQ